jgi:hypothetical protein
VLGYHGGVHVVHHGHFGGGHYGHAPFADDLALAIAIDLAVAHGGQLHGFHSGSLSQVPGMSSYPHGGQHNANNSRQFNLPGIARDKYAIEVLVWPHGKCEPQYEIRKLATRAGMKRIHPRNDGNADIDRIKLQILANTPFGDDDDPVNRPNGWYREAKGQTHVWREYFQLQPCNFGSLQKLLGNPNWDPWRTYLVVSGVTWTYKHADGVEDCETRVAFSIWSKGLVISGQWDWRWDEIKDHRECAEKLAAGLLRYLNRFPAPAAAIEVRNSKQPEDYEPDVPPAAPTFDSVPTRTATFVPVDAINPGTDQFDQQQVDQSRW